RYRMEIDEIVERADFAVNKLSFKALVLQSGEDDYYTTERLVELVQRIRKRCGVLILLSIGEREIECYRELFMAGARGVLLRFETSNQTIYQDIHTTLCYQERIKLLKGLKGIGYIIATGAIIGLPGQREEDLLDDITLARSLSADMYSFGPLIPHPDTPLAKTAAVDIDTILKIIAVTRLIDPKGNILVTTAMETIFGREGKRLGTMAGANSMMINLTPSRYKRLYSIYPKKEDGDRDVHKKIKETLAFLYSLGRAPTDIGVAGTLGTVQK
ncbi:MAG: radical SAM protein, partial [Thermodesulfobacteriota bacterium]